MKKEEIIVISVNAIYACCHDMDKDMLAKLLTSIYRQGYIEGLGKGEESIYQLLKEEVEKGEEQDAADAQNQEQT